MYPSPVIALMLHKPKANQQADAAGMARGLAVWLLIMVIETVHGVLRGLLLVPRVGEEAASRIGWPIGMALVLAVSVLTIRWTKLERKRDLLALGAIWAMMTIGFEIMIGLMRGMSRAAVLAELNPISGLMVYSAAVMFLAPVAASWIRNRLNYPRPHIRGREGR